MIAHWTRQREWRARPLADDPRVFVAELTAARAYDGLIADLEG